MSSSIPDDPGVRAPNEPRIIGPSISETRATKPARISMPFIAGTALLAVCGLIAALRQEAWEYPVLRVLNANAGRWALLDRTVHALTTRDLLEGVVFVALLWFYGSTGPITTYGHAVDRDAGGIAGRSIKSSVADRSAHPFAPLAHPGAWLFLPSSEPDALNHSTRSRAIMRDLFRAGTRHPPHQPTIGIFAFTWAIIVNMARIYDVITSRPTSWADRLGVLVVSLFENLWCQQVARRVLVFEQTRRPEFYALAFVVTYQVATLFDDVRQIGRGFASVLLHHDPFGGG